MDLHCSVPSGAKGLWSPATIRNWLGSAACFWVNWEVQRPLVTILSAATRLPPHIWYQVLSSGSYTWMDTWWGYAFGDVTFPPTILAALPWQLCGPGTAPHSADTSALNPWATIVRIKVKMLGKVICGEVIEFKMENGLTGQTECKFSLPDRRMRKNDKFILKFKYFPKQTMSGPECK